MKKLVPVLIISIFQLCAQAQTPQRPHILGIDHVSFYTTHPDGVKKLYGDVLGLASVSPIEPGGTLRYLVGTQWVGYSPAPDPNSTDRMDHVALLTDNITALRKYLIAQGIKVPQIQGQSDHSLFFVVNDPEGHKIEFVERDKGEAAPPAAPAVSKHMIHAGFLVYKREATDHFYHDILGFRPYWHGGMKDDETSWVSFQVPDGTDWIEFMLYDPAGKDRHFLGVMNHIALGVTDIQAAKAQLIKNGAKLTEEPKLGRDGKWQLNVYDPDETRVEFMEFLPKEKPCCSEFTGPHPGSSAPPSAPSKP